MNKKKFNMQALALGVMLAMSSVAMAGEGPGAVTLINTTGNLWSASIGNTPLVGGFTDVYTFSPAATDGSTAWGSVVNTSFFGLSEISFTAADLNGTQLWTGAQTSFPMDYNFATLMPATFSGTLVLTIHGISTGGSYGGDFTVNLSPVPEPASYGMMLGGLGILAMLARRRKQQ